MKYFGILSLLLMLTHAGWAEKSEAIILLDEYKNKTYPELVEIFGPPTDKTGYTIENGPTKSWNHGVLYSKYPKIPENYNIQIMEVVWDLGEYGLYACFHMIEGENRCLLAKKIHKSVRF